MMKNLLDDPDVMRLYKSLQNQKYKDIEDYLTSNPTEEYNQEIIKPIHKLPEQKIWVDGTEVSGYIESDDYGL